MKITVRKLKRTWGYCQNNSKHGKTPIELTIIMGGYTYLRVWLCESCLNELKNKMTMININHE